MPVVSADVEEELVDRLEEYQDEHDCRSRSAAIREALLDGLDEGPTVSELVSRALWIFAAVFGFAAGALAAISPQAVVGGLGGVVITVVVAYGVRTYFTRGKSGEVVGS